MLKNKKILIIVLLVAMLAVQTMTSVKINMFYDIYATTENKRGWERMRRFDELKSTFYDLYEKLDLEMPNPDSLFDEDAN